MHMCLSGITMVTSNCYSEVKCDNSVCVCVWYGKVSKCSMESQEMIKSERRSDTITLQFICAY